MKKIAMFAFVALLISCESQEKPKMKDNFNIIIKDMSYSIDIKKREYVRHYTTRDTLVSFVLSNKEIFDIYNTVNQCNIFELDNNYNPCGYTDTLPVSEIDMIVINGSESKKIHIKSATYFLGDWQKVKKIRYLIEKVMRIVHLKNEVLSLPGSDMYLE